MSNVRQDFLHKLSRKIVNDNQVVIVENLKHQGYGFLGHAAQT
ncbi:hypothetical protein [Okeania sp. SIO2B3]